MNRSDGSWHCCRFPIFRENNSVLVLNTMWIVGFLWMSFLKFRNFPATPNCVRVSMLNVWVGIEFYQMSFLHLLKWSCVFFFILLIRWSTLINFKCKIRHAFFRCTLSHKVLYFIQCIFDLLIFCEGFFCLHSWVIFVHTFPFFKCVYDF